ncbi:MAG: hypothetical protein HZA89_02625 [Verrucomicrobia bacterium]|nr:hypothetical protein [Verrucomicrobiota bacterium]
MSAGCQAEFSAPDYDLAATLASGQAFRWRPFGVPASAGFPDRLKAGHRTGGEWEGVIGPRWVRLELRADVIVAQTARPQHDWQWLREYLQFDVNLSEILRTFPDDTPMRDAVAACRGLRLLRQEPWECLASFILSSTKQIVQIRQIVALLCERFGEPVPRGGNLQSSHAPSPRPSPPVGERGKTGGAFAFPSAARIAACTEAELRACKMGFRAPYLLKSARKVAGGEVNLERLKIISCAEARDELLKLPGVGRKIADCVLLFAYGFQEAFPVDVWVRKALRQLYFPRRRVTEKRLARFAAEHFGPNAGYAQQYLFHFVRTRGLPPVARPAKA